MAGETDWFEVGASLVSETHHQCASQAVKVTCGSTTADLCARPVSVTEDADEEDPISIDVTRLDWVFRTDDLEPFGELGYGIEIEWVFRGETRTYRSVQRRGAPTSETDDEYQIDTIIHTVLQKVV